MHSYSNTCIYQVHLHLACFFTVLNYLHIYSKTSHPSRQFLKAGCLSHYSQLFNPPSLKSTSSVKNVWISFFTDSNYMYMYHDLTLIKFFECDNFAILHYVLKSIILMQSCGDNFLDKFANNKKILSIVNVFTLLSALLEIFHTCWTGV